MGGTPAPGTASARGPSSDVAHLATPSPSRLRLGLITAEASNMIERYTPLAESLARALDRADGGTVVAHASQEWILGKLCDGSIDVVLESLYSVAEVTATCGVAPLAVAAKGNNYRYRSVIFVRGDSEVRTLGDLGGRDILFEDESSTSGYVMPRIMLEDAGLTLIGVDEPARAGAVRYRFGREEANLVGWIVHGLAASASTSDHDLEEFHDADLRTVATSPPLPRQLLAVGPHIDAERRRKLLAALMAMNESASAKPVLEKADTAGFQELTPQDWELVERMGKKSKAQVVR